MSVGARTAHERLAAFRNELVRLDLDGFILATGDEHLTEFPAPYARRLAWLTGFTGSTGSAVVLANSAAMFVDGRYTAAVREQVAAADWSYHDVPQTSVADWLSQHAGGARVGYDPKLHTRSAVRGFMTALNDGGGRLVALQANPIDALWTDQPAPPATQVFEHSVERAGKSSAEKRRDVGDWLSSEDADACVLVALDSIAWLLNIRGDDIAIAPLSYAYAICHRDGTVDLFIDEMKISAEIKLHLGNSVRLAPYDTFHASLRTLGGKLVSIDPNLSPEATYAALEAGGARIREDRDPVVLPKAIKNVVEIAGTKQAHIRDGAALTRFLYWFAQEAPKGGLTELKAAAQLNRFRQETPLFHSLSFDPISAADYHAAIPHYWPTEDTDAPIKADSIYLVDSGGQYPDGTTDVTRTVAVGRSTKEVRQRFTEVLKGYIALETAAFPENTLGSRIEVLARVPLWASGVDCAHGIGHGVGQFLNVHEGPAYLAPPPRPSDAPIEAGMILSIEPGYYKAGAFGIRTENLVVVVERPIAGAERSMLGFEAITLAPIDRTLIERRLLTKFEADWLDAYHQQVLHKLSPHLSFDERAWLEEQTAPIRDTALNTDAT